MRLIGFWKWLAWRLPKSLVYWASIRLSVAAARAPDAEPMPELTCVEAARIWEAI